MADRAAMKSYGEQLLRRQVDPNLLGQLTRPIVFLDTETTGLGDDAEVWDVAWVKVREDGQLSGNQAFLHIDHLVADPIALSIGRFYQRSPQSPIVRRKATVLASHPSTSDPDEVAQDLFVDAFDTTLAGIVPSADATWLKSFLRVNGYPVPWHYKILDVHTFATGVLAHHLGQNTSQWTSEAVIDALGLSIADEDRHTAWGDALLAFDMYFAALALSVGKRVGAD